MRSAHARRIDPDQSRSLVLDANVGGGAWFGVWCDATQAARRGNAAWTGGNAHHTVKRPA